MKKENHKHNSNNINMEVSTMPSVGEPENVIEMVNNYGTYEIQATSDTANQYPAIAQGFNKGIIKHDCINKDAKNYKEFKE